MESAKSVTLFLWNRYKKRDNVPKATLICYNGYMETAETFGQWLKNERKRRRLTQQALGQQVSYSAAQIRKVEAGERAFGDAQARLLAEYLSVGPDEQEAFVAWARGGEKPENLSLLSSGERSGVGSTQQPTPEAARRGARRAVTSKPTRSYDQAQQETESPQAKPRSRSQLIWAVSGAIVMVAVIGLMFVMYQRGHAAGSGHIVPGGRWLSPTQNFMVREDTLHFAALAYPSHGGDPAIAFVNFTVSWLTPTGDWRVACTATTPVAGTQDRYECDWNLAGMSVPNGVVKVSFDVYDIKGNVNMAPNGIHEGTVQR